MYKNKCNSFNEKINNELDLNSFNNSINSNNTYLNNINKQNLTDQLLKLNNTCLTKDIFAIILPFFANTKSKKA